LQINGERMIRRSDSINGNIGDIFISLIISAGAVGALSDPACAG